MVNYIRIWYRCQPSFVGHKLAITLNNANLSGFKDKIEWTNRVQGFLKSEPQNRRIMNIEFRRVESLRSFYYKL